MTRLLRTGLVAAMAAAAFGTPSAVLAGSSHTSGSSSKSASHSASSPSSAHATSSSSAPASSSLPASSGKPSVDQIVLSTLQAERDFGADPVSGGAYVNWRYGVGVNYNGRFQPQTPTTYLGHDALTDLRFLHDLWLYTSTHPADHQFDASINRYTAVVKREFGGKADRRGWIYDELMGIGSLSHDPWYSTTARGMGAAYSRWFNAKVGTIYQTSTAIPQGFYRTDEAIQQGAVLIEAGTTFGQPAWVAEGRHVLDFVQKHAYVPAAGAYLRAMSNVVARDGSANRTETVSTTEAGGWVRLGELGSEATSLLEAAHALGNDPTLMARAGAILDDASSSRNVLHLWDSTFGGYFTGAIFPGTTNTNPGAPKVDNTAKETARQLLMLEAYKLADRILLGQPYKSMEAALVQAARNAYYAPGHGFLYKMRPAYTPVHVASCNCDDTVVTSEANGIALEALQY